MFVKLCFDNYASLVGQTTRIQRKVKYQNHTDGIEENFVDPTECIAEDFPHFRFSMGRFFDAHTQKTFSETFF